MAYIGVSPSNGVRQKHTYTATANQTSFSGAGAEGISLSYLDSNYVDVYQNGVKLSEADYTSTTGTTVVLATGATVSDMIEIIVYDVFSVADTVSKADGGTFDGAVTLAGGVSGDTTFNNVVAIVGDLQSSTDGTSNFRAGVNAGDSIQSGGNYNVLVGDEAGQAITTGDNNVAVGFEALSTEDTHSRNTAIGHQSLKTLNAGANAQSTAVGYNSAKAVTTGIENTFIGASSGESATTPNYTVAVGKSALGAVLTGDYNTAIGYHAGLASTSATLNTLVGAFSGDALTTGTTNCALGYLTLSSETTAQRNTAMGYSALANQNFASGQQALNTAYGFFAGLDVTTGKENTLIGGNAAENLTDADYNVAIGVYALNTDTKGSKTVAIGRSALSQQNFTSATDSNNTAVGYYAGLQVTDGTSNSFVGKEAGKNVTTGSNNVFVGTSAGDGSGGASITTGNGNVMLGRNTGASAGGDAFSIVIGINANGKGSNTGFISPNDGAVYQGNNSSSWTTTSDRRLKKNITDSTVGLAEINKLQIRNFEYRTANELDADDGLASTDIIKKEGVQVGVVAQEIQAVLPNTVQEETTGVLSVDSDNLTWHLIKAVQELSAKNDALEARIKTLEG